MLFTLEERFQTIQHDFKEKYYHHFTDEEENKLIYMDIFKEYVSGSDFVIRSRFEHCWKVTVAVIGKTLFSYCTSLLTGV